jgi:hypothetical protein
MALPDIQKLLSDPNTPPDVRERLTAILKAIQQASARAVGGNASVPGAAAAEAGYDPRYGVPTTLPGTPEGVDAYHPVLRKGGWNPMAPAPIPAGIPPSSMADLDPSIEDTPLRRADYVDPTAIPMDQSGPWNPRAVPPSADLRGMGPGGFVKQGPSMIGMGPGGFVKQGPQADYVQPGGYGITPGYKAPEGLEAEQLEADQGITPERVQATMADLALAENPPTPATTSGITDVIEGIKQAYRAAQDSRPGGATAIQDISGAQGQAQGAKHRQAHDELVAAQGRPATTTEAGLTAGEHGDGTWFPDITVSPSFGRSGSVVDRYGKYTIPGRDGPRQMTTADAVKQQASERTGSAMDKDYWRRQMKYGPGGGLMNVAPEPLSWRHDEELAKAEQRRIRGEQEASKAYGPAHHSWTQMLREQDALDGKVREGGELIEDPSVSGLVSLEARRVRERNRKALEESPRHQRAAGAPAARAQRAANRAASRADVHTIANLRMAGMSPRDIAALAAQNVAANARRHAATAQERGLTKRESMRQRGAILRADKEGAQRITEIGLNAKNKTDHLKLLGQQQKENQLALFDHNYKMQQLKEGGLDRRAGESDAQLERRHKEAMLELEKQGQILQNQNDQIVRAQDFVERKYDEGAPGRKADEDYKAAERARMTAENVQDRADAAAKRARDQKWEDKERALSEDEHRRASGRAYDESTGQVVPHAADMTPEDAGRQGETMPVGDRKAQVGVVMAAALARSGGDPNQAKVIAQQLMPGLTQTEINTWVSDQESFTQWAGGHARRAGVGGLGAIPVVGPMLQSGSALVNLLSGKFGPGASDAQQALTE